MEPLSFDFPTDDTQDIARYQSFSQANERLANLQPIDYYFAEHVCQVLGTHNALVFHLAIACHQHLQNGHTCLPINEVANTYLGQAFDEHEQSISHQGYLIPQPHVIDETLARFPELSSGESLMVLHNQHLYLRRYYLFEQQLSQALSDKRAIVQGEDQNLIKQVIGQLFQENHTDTETIDWQKIAVANALNKNFVVIAGGPGTGKTYTVTKLLAALIMLHQKQSSAERLNIALSAPTGKAAQRLSESIVDAIDGFKGNIDLDVLSDIPTDAQTIHRLLGVRNNDVNFKHNQDNLLPVDVLLVDEASMIDLALMTRIFRALPAHAKVILLGDADQLPSVASGSVLADIAPRPHQGYTQQNTKFLTHVLDQNLSGLCAKDQTNTSDHLTILQHSRRFDGQGGIGVVAKRVIEGDAKAAWQRLENDPSNQVSLMRSSTDNWLTSMAEKYYRPLLTESDIEVAFKQLAMFRILVAMRKGDFGVERLNQRIIEYFINAQFIDGSQAFKKQPMYHGMPIMITENHHKMGLYNGDIGLVWQQNGQLVVLFEQSQGYKSVIPSRLPSFEVVYAMTIHKTQGSEFNHVLMALPDANQHKLLTRELLYTGITRAKKQLSIVSSMETWQQGVKAQVVRHSQLVL
ncbi:exodeoxyribonuclease V subunit alpha [Thalassotalea eurytherma]|uniref:RecBCD enzyme subunit RecD n=1 Tax=Thalassotalea eurytherma TaxID=1144278 RepID=A0ABQ6H1Y5_9GAMM|nr:exodeoxyribonuclease V subunit alpha [Thalassotalea eurytherma]GLX82213.1 RecBCD enzyme subunit RecD [Thalassotalea eurytherma]